MSHPRSISAGIASLVGSCVLLPSAVALADPPPPPASPAPPPAKVVEGHIGVATPLVTVSKKTTTISDQFTLLDPIGIGFKASDHVILDFETVVATPLHPVGNTGLVVDPGVVYDWGPVATGLRVAFQTNTLANVGLIPLVHRGVVDLGGATWFVEAAFPTFVQNHEVAFNVVFHTGFGF